ncbi:hypothetical protein [Roseivirga misakiensis]|uniref:Uncharacterized protein n=1 Tax=Roseivirga misakiensis TaxID=1563681 RepID=A0A1E5T3T7_9BACT|nr:hypothetical protein [Roseivirga misakiensis]OEK05937.1 hypothetical protein BFP71_07440 [Roseivirga misakiensis]
MRNVNGIKSTLALLVMVLFVVGCAASNTASTGTTAKNSKKEKPYDPTGTWEYTVETPDGANGGKFIIAGNPGAYSASLETDQFGTLELQNLDVQGTAMTGDIEVMGNTASIECDFDGDTMSGAIYFGEDSFPLEGKRVSK